MPVISWFLAVGLDSWPGTLRRKFWHGGSGHPSVFTAGTPENVITVSVRLVVVCCANRSYSLANSSALTAVSPIRISAIFVN